MEIKTITILTVMLLMTITCAAEEGTISVGESLEFNEMIINIDTVEYDGTVEDKWGKTEYEGKYEIDGTAKMDDKTYESDINAYGKVWTKDGKLSDLDLDLNGKIYQNSEPGYLYKENDKDHYGYVENGYSVKGFVLYSYKEIYTFSPIFLSSDLTLNPYSEYVITKVIPCEKEEEKDDGFTLSSPALGLGYKGSKMGDVIPALFTYRDPNTGKRVVSEVYPTDHKGAVICTPARIAGEPLFPSNFWTTPKGLRILESKANNK